MDPNNSFGLDREVADVFHDVSNGSKLTQNSGYSTSYNSANFNNTHLNSSIGYNSAENFNPKNFDSTNLNSNDFNSSSVNNSEQNIPSNNVVPGIQNFANNQNNSGFQVNHSINNPASKQSPNGASLPTNILSNSHQANENVGNSFNNSKTGSNPSQIITQNTPQKTPHKRLQHPQNHVKLCNRCNRAQLQHVIQNLTCSSLVGNSAGVSVVPNSGINVGIQEWLSNNTILRQSLQWQQQQKHEKLQIDNSKLLTNTNNNNVSSSDTHLGNPIPGKLAGDNQSLENSSKNQIFNDLSSGLSRLPTSSGINQSPSGNLTISQVTIPSPGHSPNGLRTNLPPNLGLPQNLLNSLPQNFNFMPFKQPSHLQPSNNQIMAPRTLTELTNKKRGNVKGSSLPPKNSKHHRSITPESNSSQPGTPNNNKKFHPYPSKKLRSPAIQTAQEKVSKLHNLWQKVMIYNDFTALSDYVYEICIAGSLEQMANLELKIQREICCWVPKSVYEELGIQNGGGSSKNSSGVRSGIDRNCMFKPLCMNSSPSSSSGSENNNSCSPVMHDVPFSGLDNYS